MTTQGLLNGDIPYFYLTGDEPYVLHELGTMSRRNNRFTLKRSQSHEGVTHRA